MCCFFFLIIISKRLVYRITCFYQLSEGEVIKTFICISHDYSPPFFKFSLRTQSSINKLKTLIKPTFSRDFSGTIKIKPRIFIPNGSTDPQQSGTRPDTNESSQKVRDHLKRDKINCPILSIFFEDGMRSVDFVLVWDAFTELANTPEAQQKRKVFEANLIEEGLELEHVPQESSGLNFVKVSFFISGDNRDLMYILGACTTGYFAPI